MQRKKNISLLISLVVLILACVVIYWSGRSDSTLQIDETLFRVDDFKSIDRIVLRTAQHQVELKYLDNRWRINDRYPADRNMVDVLFATLQQAIPKRPVAERLQDSVGTELEKNGVHVSLFTGQELKKEFLAGGNDRKNQAYFRLAGQATPYLMMIPGYRVYVSGILELDENGWRDKYVFGFNWQNFKRLDAIFPTDSKKNFSVIMRNRIPVVEGIGEAEIDTARLNTFLDNISLLTVDRFLSSGDSLRKENPIMKVRIEDIAGRNYTADFFVPVANQVPALIQETDPALFDSRKVQEILRSREYFRMKGP